MLMANGLSRRGFVGGLAGALGGLGFAPDSALWAEPAYVRRAKRMLRPQEQDYDALAKLANNENPYGPCDAAMEAMTG
ncbi:MAG: twin-arginine translocation signal domain-containing protein, partial [Longimicrobiales bacterium]